MPLFLLSIRQDQSQYVDANKIRIFETVCMVIFPSDAHDGYNSCWSNFAMTKNPVKIGTIYPKYLE